MALIELNRSNLLYPALNLDNIAFNREQAESIYRILLSLGGLKDAKFFWDSETGRIYIMRKFYYTDGLMPIEGKDDKRSGDQYHSLSSYIKLLIRFDRAAYKRMKNVEHKISTMYDKINALKNQM
jgi:hypothetical protein